MGTEKTSILESRDGVSLNNKNATFPAGIQARGAELRGHQRVRGDSRRMRTQETVGNFPNHKQ